MASLKTFTHKRNQGFTLIEIIVVMTVMSFLFGLTLFMSMDTYHGTTFRDERDVFIGILQKSRSQAMNNICLGGCSDSKPHGVHIAGGQFTIFQGASYASRDTAVDEVHTLSPLVTVGNGSASDIVFTQLSGDAVTTPAGVWYVVLNDNTGHVSTTTLNSFGQIAWTN